MASVSRITGSEHLCKRDRSLLKRQIQWKHSAGSDKPLIKISKRKVLERMSQFISAVNNNANITFGPLFCAINPQFKIPSCIALHVCEHYFEELFSGDEAITTSFSTVCLDTVPSWSDVSNDAVEISIPALWSGKALGPDLIPSELFEADSCWVSQGFSTSFYLYQFLWPDSQILETC